MTECYSGSAAGCNAWGSGPARTGPGLIREGALAHWAIPSSCAAVHGHVPDVAGAMGKPEGRGSGLNSQGLPVQMNHGQAQSVGELGSPFGLPMARGMGGCLSLALLDVAMPRVLRGALAGHLRPVALVARFCAPDLA